MEPATIAVVGLSALAMYLAWRHERHKDEKRNIQFDLRYPELDTDRPGDDTFSARTFVDFEQMVLVSETSDYDYHQTRVFHLRRLDGPKWEIQEEETSRERSRAHYAAMKERGWDWVEKHEAEVDSVEWKPCGYSEDIEPKYQLFLRHRDPVPPWQCAVAAAALDHVGLMHYGGLEIRGADDLPPGPYWALHFVELVYMRQSWLELVKTRPVKPNGKAAMYCGERVALPDGREAGVWGVVAIQRNRKVRDAYAREKLRLGKLIAV